MARTLTFVPTAEPTTGATIELVNIPQDVIDEVEETYKTLKTNAGRIRVEFGDKAELNQYVNLVTSYCAQRKNADGTAAPIRFRRSPTKGLADNVMDFRITDLQTANEKATAEIREATDKANAAATPADVKPLPAKPAKSTGKAA